MHQELAIELIYPETRDMDDTSYELARGLVAWQACRSIPATAKPTAATGIAQVWHLAMAPSHTSHTGYVCYPARHAKTYALELHTVCLTPNDTCQTQILPRGQPQILSLSADLLEAVVNHCLDLGLEAAVLAVHLRGRVDNLDPIAEFENLTTVHFDSPIGNVGAITCLLDDCIQITDLGLCVGTEMTRSEALTLTRHQGMLELERFTLKWQQSSRDVATVWCRAIGRMNFLVYLHLIQTPVALLAAALKSESIITLEMTHDMDMADYAIPSAADSTRIRSLILNDVQHQNCLAKLWHHLLQALPKTAVMLARGMGQIRSEGDFDAICRHMQNQHLRIISMPHTTLSDRLQRKLHAAVRTSNVVGLGYALETQADRDLLRAVVTDCGFGILYFQTDLASIPPDFYREIHRDLIRNQNVTYVTG